MARRREAPPVRPGKTTRSDPFQLLIAEHELLRGQLRRARAGQPSGISGFASAVRTHIEREARALEPMCERLFGGPDGAVAVMREDHAALRARLRRLVAADRRRAEMAARLAGFAEFFEAHLAREERVLFPLMAALLTGMDAGRMAECLREGDRGP